MKKMQKVTKRLALVTLGSAAATAVAYVIEKGKEEMEVLPFEPVEMLETISETVEGGVQ